jgi:hypothetical protein
MGKQEVTVLESSAATEPKPLSFGSGKGRLNLGLHKGFDQIDGLDAQARYVFINVLQGHLDRLFAKPTTRPSSVLTHDETILYATNRLRIEATASVEAEIDASINRSVQMMLNFSMGQAMHATVMLLRSEEIFSGELMELEALDAFVEWAIEALVHDYDLHLAELNPAKTSFND